MSDDSEEPAKGSRVFCHVCCGGVRHDADGVFHLLVVVLPDHDLKQRERVNRIGFIGYNLSPLAVRQPEPSYLRAQRIRIRDEPVFELAVLHNHIERRTGTDTRQRVRKRRSESARALVAGFTIEEYDGTIDALGHQNFYRGLYRSRDLPDRGQRLYVCFQRREQHVVNAD